jgi:adenylate cyclase class 2
MKELEIKLLNIDRSKVLKNLKKAKAKKIFAPTKIIETYFTDGKKNSPFTGLRLRTIGRKCELTLKYKRTDSNFLQREELESEVSNYAQMRLILERLGYKAFRERQKIREEYEILGVKIDIDQYPKIPCFLEIEGKSQKQIKSVIKELDLGAYLLSSLTATDLLKSYKVNPDALTF